MIKRPPPYEDGGRCLQSAAAGSGRWRLPP